MEPTSQLLPAAHRVIRPVDAGESAFVGVLVADGEGVRVRVDVESVGAALWRHGDAAHIAGVRDLIRRADGHDALLPWCAERIAAFLARREAAGATLSPGEAVTLVGSLLRGLEEAGTEPLVGVWWLADDARPLFVPGEGDAMIAATRTLVGKVRGAIADRALDRVLADVERMPDDARVVRRRLAAWESSLTAHAAPRALRRDMFAPEPVASIPLHRAHLVAPLDEPERRGLRSVIGRTATQAGGLLGSVRDALARIMSRRGRVAVGERAGEHAAARSRPPRRRMVIVAAAAGATVLAAGLLWPQEPESSRAEEPAPVGGTRASVERPVDASPPAEVPAEGEMDDTGAETSVTPPATDSTDPTSEDAVAAAAALLSLLVSCRADGDTACAEAVAPGGGERVLTALMSDVTTPHITPVEDYGDVAVVRVEAKGRRQMLVLERQNDSWLVRDVYDVADQP